MEITSRIQRAAGAATLAALALPSCGRAPEPTPEQAALSPSVGAVAGLVRELGQAFAPLSYNVSGGNAQILSVIETGTQAHLLDADRMRRELPAFQQQVEELANAVEALRKELEEGK